MKTVGMLRAENLESLIKQLGTLEGVAAAAGSSSVYLSQIRNRALDMKTGRPREMGAQMARRIEAGCDKPSGWMDADHNRRATAHDNAGTEGANAYRPQEGEATLLIAAETIARYMVGADEMTRESIAPLLARLARVPEEAPRIRRMIQALVQAVPTPRSDVLDEHGHRPDFGLDPGDSNMGDLDDIDQKTARKGGTK